MRGTLKMMEIHNFFSRATPKVQSILRIMTALLFMQHGGQKLFGFPAEAHSEFVLFSLAGLAGILEFFGSMFILAGLLTRPISFLLSGFMAVAYFMAHAPQGFYPLVNKGELAVIFCFIYLFFSVAGGGEWSLDHYISSAKKR
jgi:putative oxidoreductase